MKEKMDEALADIVTMENLSFTKVQKYIQKETPIPCMSWLLDSIQHSYEIIDES